MDGNCIVMAWSRHWWQLQLEQETICENKQLLQEMKKIQKSICEMWRGCQRNANGIAAITLSQGAFNDIFRTEWTFNANRKHMNWPPEGVSADVFEQTSPRGTIPSPSLPEECRILCSSQIVEQVFVSPSYSQMFLVICSLLTQHYVTFWNALFNEDTHHNIWRWNCEFKLRKIVNLNCPENSSKCFQNWKSL